MDKKPFVTNIEPAEFTNRPPYNIQKPRFTVSTAEAAEVLGISRSTVTRLIQDGTLKAYKLHPTSTNSPWRIHYSSIESLLHQRQPDEKEAAARAGAGG